MTIILAFDFKLGVEDLAEDVVTIEEMVDLVVDVIVQEIAIEVSRSILKKHNLVFLIFGWNTH